MNWEATKATNVFMRGIITNDDPVTEDYALSENQTPDLCYCRHNNKPT